MSLVFTKTACASDASQLRATDGVDIRFAECVGITVTREDETTTARAFVLVPTDVAPHGGFEWAKTRWERCEAADVGPTKGFESLDVRRLAALRLAYVAEKTEVVFTVRKAA